MGRRKSAGRKAPRRDGSIGGANRGERGSRIAVRADARRSGGGCGAVPAQCRRTCRRCVVGRVRCRRDGSARRRRCCATPTSRRWPGRRRCSRRWRRWGRGPRGSRAGAWWRRRDTWGGRAWRRRLRSFKAEGVWGTSPHLIPHFALHSPSGTISLALGLHGPNLGVGGGLHAAAEGFLAAMTWLSAGVVPGVWLVLSGWSPELIPDRRGVAVAGAGRDGRSADRDRMPRPGRGAAARRRDEHRAGRRSGWSSAGRRSPSRPRSTWSGWPRGWRVAGGPSPRTIATDPAGSAPGRAGRRSRVRGVEVKRHGQRRTGLDHGHRGRDPAGLRPGGDRVQAAGRPLGGHAGRPGSRPTTIPAGSPRRSGRSHARRIATRSAFAALNPLEQVARWCAETALRDAGLLGPASRGAGRAGAGPGCRVDVPVGDR